MAGLIHGDITFEIIGGAIDVHRELGPGFLESIYQRAMEAELRRRRLPYDAQHRISLTYKGEAIGDHVLDLVVDDSIVVELKAVKELSDQHRAQVISYLKASHLQIGLLFNFAKASLDHKRILLSEALR